MIQSVYDPLYVVGAGGLGASLFLIHIYVTPIKRALQALWAVGVLGSVGVAVNFAAPVHQGLVAFALDHPAAIWAVGPLFASLTGLVFKEGEFPLSPFLECSILCCRSSSLDDAAPVSDFPVVRSLLSRILYYLACKLQGFVMANQRQLLCSSSFRRCCLVAL